MLPEIISVGDAWHAVAVESQSPQFVKNVCGTYSNGEFLQAISELTAAKGCTTLVNSSTSTVYFASRDRVILYAGFKANNGSKFVAYLEPCSSTRWLVPPREIMSDAEKGIRSYAVQMADTSKQSEMANEKADESVTIAPNPFSGSFVISINAKKDGKAQVGIYNSLGRKVKEQQSVNVVRGINKLSYNGSNLAQGVYMLEVNFGDSKTVKKIVKM
jgi:bacillolysin